MEARPGEAAYFPQVARTISANFRDCSTDTGANPRIVRREQEESTSDPLTDDELAPNSANGSIPSRIAWTEPIPPGNAATVSNFLAIGSRPTRDPPRSLRPLSQPSPAGLLIWPHPRTAGHARQARSPQFPRLRPPHCQRAVISPGILASPRRSARANAAPAAIFHLSQILCF